MRRDYDILGLFIDAFRYLKPGDRYDAAVQLLHAFEADGVGRVDLELVLGISKDQSLKNSEEDTKS